MVVTNAVNEIKVEDYCLQCCCFEVQTKGKRVCLFYQCSHLAISLK